MKGGIATGGAGSRSRGDVCAQVRRSDGGDIVLGGGGIGVVGMCETTSDWVPWTWTGQFRRQRSLAGAVEGRGQSGRERFGEMAIVLFIGGHSCGAGAEAGMAIHRRLQSMMALATVNSQASFDLDSVQHLRGLMGAIQGEGGRMARGLENIQA